VGNSGPLVGIRGSGELGGPTTDREWGLGAVGSVGRQGGQGRTLVVFSPDP